MSSPRPIPSANQVWRVERPGTGPANDHESEHALRNYRFDRIIHNDGTLQDLRKRVLCQ